MEVRGLVEGIVAVRQVAVAHMIQDYISHDEQACTVRHTLACRPADTRFEDTLLVQLRRNMFRTSGVKAQPAQAVLKRASAGSSPWSLATLRSVINSCIVPKFGFVLYRSTGLHPDIRLVQQTALNPQVTHNKSQNVICEGLNVRHGSCARH